MPQLAGAVVVIRFAGSPAPAYVPAALREGRAAGVILFRDNTGTRDATRASPAGCSARRRARPR